MSKKNCKCNCACSCNTSCKLDPCGCPTPRMCCGSVAVPTTSYQMVSVPQMVYDNVPASPCGMGPSTGNCLGGNWLILLLLLCCGNGFGGGCGCDDGCGDFGGNWLILLLLLCCCGNGLGC